MVTIGRVALLEGWCYWKAVTIGRVDWRVVASGRVVTIGRVALLEGWCYWKGGYYRKGGCYWRVVASGRVANYFSLQFLLERKVTIEDSYYYTSSGVTIIGKNG